MLCPEVWRFQAPSHEIVQKTGVIDLTSKRNTVTTKIGNHPFNQLITLVVPDVSIPLGLETALADTDHYLVRNLSLQVLVGRPFIEGFVRRGTFYAISCGTHLDTDDCVVVDPSGTLILHLNKETYQCLGLEGKISQFAHKRENKYVVRICLKSLQPETKYYNRVRDCLGRESLGRFNLQITWTPPVDGSTTICPSSVAKYFADMQSDTSDIKVELMPTSVKVNQEYGLSVPILSLDVNSKNVEYCSNDELVEYIGLLALSCDTKEQDYLNSYDFCGQRTEVSNAKVLHWKGFFTIAHVLVVFEAIMEMLRIEETVPWIAMYVHGFSNSPLSFGVQENYFHTNGDHSYTVVVNPKGEFLWYQLAGNNKKPK